MIKINLSSDKKKELEKIFLTDLLGEENNNSHKGKLVKTLEKETSRTLLRREYDYLYSFFYTQSGDLKTNEVKKLLLADKAKMAEYINHFKTYDLNNETDRIHSNKLLNQIFTYENFSKRKAAYEIAVKAGITVCPYCNRTYIMSLQNRKVKAQFDHYFPKSKYPYLALSLYNLIPCCSICNMAKSNMDTKETPVLYPYEEEFGEKIVFTVNLEDNEQFVKCLTGISDDIKVLIKNPDHILE